MAGRQGGPVARIIRTLVLLGVLGGGGWLAWHALHKQEGYTRGDIVTTGTVDADHVSLAFKVGGRLAEVPVQEGDRVKAGQLVARLETPDFDVQLRAARAAVQGAAAKLAEAQATRRRAAVDYARARRLMGEDATTMQQLDLARAEADVANAQIGAASAGLRSAEAALAQAELNRSYCELRAPEAGQVTERVHLPGEILAAGTPVVSVSQLDTVKVIAAVDETRVGAVRPGDSARVRVYTFDRRYFEGVVTDVSAAGEFATRKDWGAQRRDIRTFAVRVRVPNPEGLLKDGMTAEVVLHVSPGVARVAGGGQ